MLLYTLYMSVQVYMVARNAINRHFVVVKNTRTLLLHKMYVLYLLKSTHHLQSIICTEHTQGTRYIYGSITPFLG